MQFQTFGAATVRLWRFGQGRPLLYLHGFEGHPGDAGRGSECGDGSQGGVAQVACDGRARREPAVGGAAQQGKERDADGAEGK